MGRTNGQFGRIIGHKVGFFMTNDWGGRKGGQGKDFLELIVSYTFGRTPILKE